MPAASAQALVDQLRRLTNDSGEAAVLCDIDGTLAPIVARPDQARVAEGVSQLLGKLSRGYACVACISGRPALQARRLVGERSITYAGLHGAELLAPGEEHPSLIASFQSWLGAILRFTAAHSIELQALGIRIEDKGPITAFHWRGLSNEDAALSQLRRVADDAKGAGLSPHWGRKVLEVRPPVPIDKGKAVSELVAESDVRAALYGGDDATDLDAFDAIDAMVADGRLITAVRVGVRSEEGPPEIVARADVVVDGVPGFKRVLEALAGSPR